MWDRRDNQEVGLEAGILERVRNSSLVKWFRADNVAGLKHTAEAVAFLRRPVGRLYSAGQVEGGAGERGGWTQAAEESSRGRHASENAGMSSERRVRNAPAGRPRVPGP